MTGKKLLRYIVPLLAPVMIFAFWDCTTAVTTETGKTPVTETLTPTSDITSIGTEILPIPTATTEETASIETTPVETIPSTTIPSGTTPSQAPEQVIVNIDAREAYDLIQENMDNPDFVIVDTRTPEEFAQGHLENAILVDYRAGDFSEEISRLDRNKKYLIYCRTGNRSSSARDIMKELGFLDIYHMDGGITDWIAEGLPVIK